MNRREEGFLLLTAKLGRAHRNPVTPREFGILKQCIIDNPRSAASREMEKQDLLDLGCPEELAEKTILLLEDQKELEAYLEQGSVHHCIPMTRITPDYPRRLIASLKEAAPVNLWLKGDTRLLNRPAVALVGSRELTPEHESFARRVGALAARQGYVLISGNARGADTLAQESCLEAGGAVICVVADTLWDKKPRRNMLYISQDGFDIPFSAQRAHSRNRLIHSMGRWTFVARCTNGMGGTWKGTTTNLKAGWTPVWCYNDGSEAAKELEHRGARLISVDDLDNIMDG